MHFASRLSCTLFALFFCPLLAVFGQNSVLINEIHYNPDVKVEQVEFIELHNRGSEVVDLSGWAFDQGVTYTFSNGVSIAAGGYLIISEDPSAFATKFRTNAVGPWVGSLNNDGENVRLVDAAGRTVDEVEYQLGFPWPTVGDAPGLSIELINPNFDNDLGGNWRSLFIPPPAPSLARSIFGVTQVWKYYQNGEAPGDWKSEEYDDSGWPEGPGLLYVESNTGVSPRNTALTLGQSAYYFRTKFDFTNDPATHTLQLSIVLDDGAVVYLNGEEVYRRNMPEGTPAHTTYAVTAVGEATSAIGPTVLDLSNLREGENQLAVEVHQATAGSSDIVFGLNLFSIARPPAPVTASSPSPMKQNSVFATNAAPATRQVEHSPNEPKSGEPVKITAKVTDPEGVKSVLLQYQVVAPGNYIDVTNVFVAPNSQYATNWTTVAMNDAGNDGDQVGNDSIYTVLLPGNLHVHRHLIRYRIVVSDNHDLEVRVPYADDPVPNFAYFVYDGIPAWRAAVRPGSTPVLEYSSNEMARLPTYHLITRWASVNAANYTNTFEWDPNNPLRGIYAWSGTLIYKGKVYDNIHYRLRGGVWRYAMGKNMWKFDFNRGHEFQAEDDYGREFGVKWSKLNFSAIIQQGDTQHRGEQGLFEAVGFRMFNMAGSPAPNTQFASFRVIDDAVEASSTSQYNGDFWGLYLIIEDVGGRFLEEHGLGDGNLYKKETGTRSPGAVGTPNGTLENQGPFQVTNSSDIVEFQNAFQSNPNALSDDWWRTNFDLDTYYAYQTIVQAIHHYDICCGKNYFYYNNPQIDRWQVLVWDLDLTWANNMYQGGTGFNPNEGNGGTGGVEPFKMPVLSGDHRGFSASPVRPQFRIEFANKVREVQDLMFNTEEAFRLIDEYARIARGTMDMSVNTIVEADRSQWDYNPIMVSGFVNTGKAGHGRYYQFPASPTNVFPIFNDFRGSVNLMKNYVIYRSGLLDSVSNDPLIPAKPTVTALTTNFSINNLHFRSSGFSSPSSVFKSMKWRVGEVTDPTSPDYDPTEPQKYEIENYWDSGDLTAFNQEIVVPASAVRVGSRYRARVQFTDQNGRTSRWSDPVEFVVGQPDSATALIRDIRITEIMFNPAAGGYEYVELLNRGTNNLDLAGMKFTQGIDFTFGNVTLPAGGRILVVRAPETNNFEAFRTYYGLGNDALIVGSFSGSLNNAGEQLTLRTSAGGTDIVSFTYGDGRGWPASADGDGHSLVFNGPLDQVEGLSYAGMWTASKNINGSPGVNEPVVPSGVVLNEIVTHTDFTAEVDSNDWIELHNTTDAEITLGEGWYLSDEGGTNLAKWQIPANTVVPARGFVTFDEVTGFHFPTNQGFGLSKLGEQAYLSYLPANGPGRIVDMLRFKGQENETSFGRHPDGTGEWRTLSPRTRNASNAAPVLNVVITEVMYHPPDGAGGSDNVLDEFIEIHNPTPTAINLFNENGPWRLDGIDFNFPANATIGPGEYILIVKFAPETEAAQLAAFKAWYGITNENLKIFGPYIGELGNSAQRMSLESSINAELGATGSGWVIIDEVLYGDREPWSQGADGYGASLQKRVAASNGLEPGNWTGAIPTPGSTYVDGEAPTITVPPQSVTIAEGLTLNLQVSATGHQPMTYVWFHNGETVPGQAGATLVLPNIQLDQFGEYSVAVVNAGGFVQSEPATVTVRPIPVILSQPVSTNQIPGASVNFRVTAEGTGPLSYQWQFNGVDIPGETASTLTVTNIQFKVNDGFFTVKVTDEIGTRTSQPAQLIVRVGAFYVMQPQPQTIPEGATLVLRVAGEGSQPIGYRWRKTPGTFANTNVATFHPTNFVLIIPNVTASDSGTYSAVMTNLGRGLPGNLSANAVVRVVPDANQNGLPDEWETAYPTAAEATGDADSDGLSNLAEFIAGTNPTNAASVLKLEVDEMRETANGLSFLAVSNKTYSVEFSDVLKNTRWDVLQNVTNSTFNRSVSVMDTNATGASRFYRIVTPMALEP